jgi:uncharacterized membrane protein YfcA
MLKLEKYVEPFVYGNKMAALEEAALTVRERVRFAREQVADIVRKVWLYVLIGVLIGAAIHNYIPADIISAILGQQKSFPCYCTFAAFPCMRTSSARFPSRKPWWERCGARHRAVLHDGGDRLVVALVDSAEESGEDTPVGCLCRDVTAGILVIGYLFNAISFLFL